MAIITEQVYTKGQAAYEQIKMTDGDTSVTLTPCRGGMITGITHKGEEFCWLRDGNFEKNERPRCGVPVLFPWTGNAADGVNHFDGQDYPTVIHGLADLLAWDVAEVSGEGVTLSLSPSGLTKVLYPYEFGLEITYQLDGDTIIITQTVTNNDEKPMPFSFGYHPYFAATKAENLEFEIDAKTCGATWADTTTPFTGKVDFPYDPKETLRVFTGVTGSLVFTDQGNGHKVTVGSDDHFTNAVLWRQAEEKMVCMEAWNGWANSVNEAGKHEVLEPGDSQTATWTITVEKV